MWCTTLLKCLLKYMNKIQVWYLNFLFFLSFLFTQTHVDTCICTDIVCYNIREWMCIEFKVTWILFFWHWLPKYLQFFFLYFLCWVWHLLVIFFCYLFVKHTQLLCLQCSDPCLLYILFDVLFSKIILRLIRWVSQSKNFIEKSCEFVGWAKGPT